MYLKNNINPGNGAYTTYPFGHIINMSTHETGGLKNNKQSFYIENNSIRFSEFKAEDERIDIIHNTKDSLELEIPHAGYSMIYYPIHLKYEIEKDFDEVLSVFQNGKFKMPDSPDQYLHFYPDLEERPDNDRPTGLRFLDYNNESTASYWQLWEYNGNYFLNLFIYGILGEQYIFQIKKIEKEEIAFIPILVAPGNRFNINGILQRM